MSRRQVTNLWCLIDCPRSLACAPRAHRDERCGIGAARVRDGDVEEQHRSAHTEQQLRQAKVRLPGQMLLQKLVTRSRVSRGRGKSGRGGGRGRGPDYEFSDDLGGSGGAVLLPSFENGCDMPSYLIVSHTSTQLAGLDTTHGPASRLVAQRLRSLGFDCLRLGLLRPVSYDLDWKKKKCRLLGKGCRLLVRYGSMIQHTRRRRYDGNIRSLHTVQQSSPVMTSWPVTALTDDGPVRGSPGDLVLHREREHPDGDRQELVGEHDVTGVVAVAPQQDVRGDPEAACENEHPHRASAGARGVRHQ